MDKFYIGMFYAILAGMVVATQNVFSAKISEKLGMWETTMVVHLVGLIFATLMVFAFGSGSLKGLADVNKVYLLAGVFGVFIIFSVANSVTLVGASLTVSLMVIAQLLFATIIDSFGLFGTEKIPLTFQNSLD